MKLSLYKFICVIQSCVLIYLLADQLSLWHRGWLVGGGGGGELVLDA